MKSEHITWALSSHPDVIDLIKEIDGSDDIKSACGALADYYESLGGQLLSVKFYDRNDDSRYVRAYFAYPDSIRSLLASLMESGGCPFSREAKRRMQPFDALDIDQSAYVTFPERRFFNEIAKTGHARIAVLPTMIGQGIALVTVGLYGQPFAGPLRHTICNSISHFISAFISRFPEVSTLFEEKVLTNTESELLRILCNGESMDFARKKLSLGEQTARLYLQSSMKKLGAQNTHQLIYKAMLMGEITVWDS